MREVPNNILHYYWISNLFGTETPHSMSHQSTFFPSINDQKREKNTKGDDILQFINIQQNVKKKKKRKKIYFLLVACLPPIMLPRQYQDSQFQIEDEKQRAILLKIVGNIQIRKLRSCIRLPSSLILLQLFMYVFCMSDVKALAIQLHAFSGS